MPLRDGMSSEHHTPFSPTTIRPRLRSALVDALADTDLDRLDGAQLAARAGLPEAVFAEHYRDVDDCFLDAYDELTCNLRERFRQQLETASGDWRQRLTSALETQIEEVFSRRGVARALFVETARSTDFELQRRRALARERLAALATSADQGDDAAEVPALHAEFLLGALSHAAQEELAAGADCASAGRRVRELLALFEPIAA